jgi:GAF domain-containing protein
MSDPSPLSYFGVEPRSREDHVLRLVVQSLIQAIGADEGSLLVAEPGGELRFVMTVGDAASEQKLLGQTVPVGKGITGLAAQSRQVQVGAPTFRDVAQTDKKSAGPEAVLAAPMLIDDTVVGVVTAVSFAPGRRFDAHAARLAGTLATVAAVIVDQAMEAKRRREAAASGGRSERAFDALAAIARESPQALDQAAAILESLRRALAVRG